MSRDDDDDFLAWRAKCWISTFETIVKKCSKQIWTAGLGLHYLDRQCKDPDMPQSTEIYPNVGKYSSINVTKNKTLWICLHMRETLRAKITQSFRYICLDKAQNKHKLLLSNTWITCLKLTKHVYGSEYAWINHGFWIFKLLNAWWESLSPKVNFFEITILFQR